jgi:phage FluMu protein Com
MNTKGIPTAPLFLEVRCLRCNVLLAKIERGALTIQRGAFEASFEGKFRAVLLCYRPRCRKLNVLRLPQQE